MADLVSDIVIMLALLLLSFISFLSPALHIALTFLFFFAFIIHLSIMGATHYE